MTTNETAASDAAEPEGTNVAHPPWDAPLSHLALEILQVTADFPGFNGEYLDRIGAKDFFAGITDADITEELIHLENATLIENAQRDDAAVPEWWITEAGTEALGEPRPLKLSKDQRAVLRALDPPKQRGDRAFAGWCTDEVTRRAGVQLTVARNTLAALRLRGLTAFSESSESWTRTEQGLLALEAAPPCSHPHDGGRIIERESEYAVRCDICGEKVNHDPQLAAGITRRIVITVGRSDIAGGNAERPTDDDLQWAIEGASRGGLRSAPRGFGLASKEGGPNPWWGCVVEDGPPSPPYGPGKDCDGEPMSVIGESASSATEASAAVDEIGALRRLLAERDAEIAALRADVLFLAEAIDDYDADEHHLDIAAFGGSDRENAMRAIIARTLKSAGKTSKCIETRTIAKALPATITVNSRFRCLDKNDESVGEIVTVRSNGFSLIGAGGEPWGEHADTVAELIESNALLDPNQWEWLQNEALPLSTTSAPSSPEENRDGGTSAPRMSPKGYVCENYRGLCGTGPCRCDEAFLEEDALARLASLNWPDHLGRPGERVLRLAAQGFQGVGRVGCASRANYLSATCTGDADAIRLLRTFEWNELADLPFPIRGVLGFDKDGNPVDEEVQ